MLHKIRHLPSSYMAEEDHCNGQERQMFAIPSFIIVSIHFKCKLQLPFCGIHLLYTINTNKRILEVVYLNVFYLLSNVYPWYRVIHEIRLRTRNWKVCSDNLRFTREMEMSSERYP